MATNAVSKPVRLSIIELIILRISQAAYAAGLAVLAIMAVLTLVDVSGRSGFNKPITGSYELTQLNFATGVALVIGYSVVLKSHIRIDMLVNTFSMKAQVVMEIISHFICTIFFLAATYAVTIQALKVHDQGTTSGILEIPTYPVYFILAFGCLLSAVLYFINFLKVVNQRKLEVG